MFSGKAAGPDVFVDVEESWKGVSEGERVRVLSDGSRSCGTDFRAGERYLVYAATVRYDEDLPIVREGSCSGTMPLSYAGPALQALGPSKGDVANVAVVASGALLFVGTLGALTYWRWRRLG